jgi:hypothetical protein
MKKGKVGQILRVNVAIPLWAILCIFVLTILASYFCAPAYRDQIKFAAVLVGGAAAIYSAYYVGAALRLTVERDRQRASFEILSLLNRPEFVKVRNFIEKEVEGHESLSATNLHNKVKSSPELEDAVAIVLGIFEDASIAIQSDFVDEEILYTSILDLVKRYFHGLRGYIEQHRKIKGVPFYFTELEKLCGAWEDGKRLSDGRPLPQLGSQAT